jgi:hypothetical protein
MTPVAEAKQVALMTDIIPMMGDWEKVVGMCCKLLQSHNAPASVPPANTSPAQSNSTRNGLAKLELPLELPNSLIGSEKIAVAVPRQVLLRPDHWLWSRPTI